MAQLIIEVNDNIAVDVRDTLISRLAPEWSDKSGAEKNAKLKAIIAGQLKSEYLEQKREDATQAAREATEEANKNADIS